ncbi:conserved hypothetical protein [Desulfosarcina cetonica]|uniref:four helix bundle protein n=1 Tax=Desulfosarcina cetonica TaxID=90730 RepID=UPI0006D2590F|nr:four helix bundle protein [Desulfosarcina cetonica]VTR64404.1 conserved hypothetical protein [Desulfosarcina cetonica]
MAQYQHLPIYKLTYDLLIRVMQVTRNFPREYKYTLGQKLKDEIIELVVLIYKANSTKEKAPYIERALEHIQVVQLMIRLSHDMRILPRKHYVDLAEKTDSLARQAQGWLKNSGKSEPERIAG